MELRRVLFEYRLRQTDVARAARAQGFACYSQSVSVIASGTHVAFPRERLAVRAGLLKCGVPLDVVESIPELIPRPDRRATEFRKPRHG